jgi:hypothetical protein
MATAARRLGECWREDHLGGEQAEIFEDIANEIRATQGEDAVGATFLALSATLDDPRQRPNPTDAPDPWLATYRRLQARERDAITKALCERLLDASADSRTYHRAAHVCPLDSPRVAEVAASRLERAFHAGPIHMGGQSQVNLDLVALHWATLLAQRGQSQAAGKAACDLFARDTTSAQSFRWFDDERHVYALLALAASHAKCAAFAVRLTRAPCGESVECEGRVCSASAIDHEIDAWKTRAEDMQRDAGNQWQSFIPNPDHVLLGAAYAQGTTAKAFFARASRRFYEIVRTKGVECAFENSLFCNLPDDGGYAQVRDSACEIRVDDRAKRAGFPRARAKPPDPVLTIPLPTP